MTEKALIINYRKRLDTVATFRCSQLILCREGWQVFFKVKKTWIPFLLKICGGEGGGGLFGTKKILASRLHIYTCFIECYIK